MSNFLNDVQDAIEQLESIRESIIQISATDENRAKLDQAYAGVASAIAGLSGLVECEVAV